MQTATIVGIKATKNVPTTVTLLGGFTATGAGASISSLLVCNTSGGSTFVTVTAFDGTNDYCMAYNMPVGPGDTLNVLGQSGSRITLAAGWGIRVISSVANSCDATMSVTSYT